MVNGVLMVIFASMPLKRYAELDVSVRSVVSVAPDTMPWLLPDASVALAPHHCIIVPRYCGSR